jgi:hypothetical protein
MVLDGGVASSSEGLGWDAFERMAEIRLEGDRDSESDSSGVGSTANPLCS